MSVQRPITLSWNAVPNQDGSLAMTITVSDNSGAALVQQSNTFATGASLEDIADWMRHWLRYAVSSTMTLSDLGVSGSVKYDFPNAIGATLPLDILL